MASRLESRRNRREIQWGGEEEHLNGEERKKLKPDEQCLEERFATSSKVNFSCTTPISDPSFILKITPNKECHKQVN
jgi:hypothetical protein